MRLLGTDAENSANGEKGDEQAPATDTDSLSQTPSVWNSRDHFFAAAAEAMRRILVEQARRKEDIKHGGERRQIELTDVHAVDEGRAVDLLALDETFSQFTAHDPRVVELVKLRYFAGLTDEEAAQALGVSTRTADRIWLYARAWLLRLSRSRRF